MKMIKDIQRQGLYLGIAMALLTFLITFNWLMVATVFLGVLACNFNLVINIRLMDLSETRDRIFKTLTGYVLRILVYAIAMILAYYLAGTIGLLLSFIGSLSIRIVILIIGIRGGMNDGYIQ